MTFKQFRIVFLLLLFQLFSTGCTSPIYEAEFSEKYGNVRVFLRVFDYRLLENEKVRHSYSLYGLVLYDVDEKKSKQTLKLESVKLYNAYNLTSFQQRDYWGHIDLDFESLCVQVCATHKETGKPASFNGKYSLNLKGNSVDYWERRIKESQEFNGEVKKILGSGQVEN